MKRTIAIALFFAACSRGPTTSADGWTKRVGVIGPELSSIQLLSMPAEVQANVPLDVTVRTLGSSSCTRAAELRTSQSSARLELTPYDEYAPRDRACTDDLHAFDHTARITIASPGTRTVRIIGRKFDGGEITYETTITVR